MKSHITTEVFGLKGLSHF